MSTIAINENKVKDEDYSKCLAGECDEEHCKYEQCEECGVLMGGKCFHEEEEYDEHPDRDDGYDADGLWYCPKHQKTLLNCKECNAVMNADGHRTYALPCGDFCKSCMEGKHSGCEVCFGDDDEDFDVDDVDAPNCFPYKKCSVCEERKSCGNYDDNKVWFCENCFDEEDENPTFDKQTFYLLEIILQKNSGELPDGLTLTDVHGKTWTSKNDAWK